MKDGVAELGVPRAGNLAQLLRNGRPFAQHQAGESDLVKLLVQRKLPGQKAPVQRGQRELQVVGIEPSRFLHRAGTGAGAQADVPHALDDRPHRFSRMLLGLLVGKGEQHIDVRKREQILAPVAAHRQQGHVLRRQIGKRPAPHLNQDAIHHRGAPPDRRRTVSGAIAGLAHQRHLPHILLPKIVHCQNDCTHRVVGCSGQPKQEGVATRISDKRRKVGVLLGDARAQWLARR